jgi:hypothetical protein
VTNARETDEERDGGLELPLRALRVGQHLQGLGSAFARVMACG